MTDDLLGPNVEPEPVPAAPEEVLPAVDESVNVELSEEEKLRQEASRRMERMLECHVTSAMLVMKQNVVDVQQGLPTLEKRVGQLTLD